MNYGKLIVRVLVQARQGDPASLDQLRKIMGADPAQADPHIFLVTGSRVLSDTVKTCPQIRSDVFPKIPEFACEFVKPSEWSPWLAIQSIQRYPPLEKLFWYEAQSEIGRLEARLVTDDLSRQDRSAIHRRLRVLMSDHQPCWINWIKITPGRMLAQFDLIVNQWLMEPIDWSEKKWFDPACSWKKGVYAVESATNFFKNIPQEVHWFFGIEMTRCLLPDSDKEFDCAVLKQSVDEANRLAELMGVKFRFRTYLQDAPPPIKKR